MPSSGSFNPEQNCEFGKSPGIYWRVWYYAAAMKICLSLLLLFSWASFAQSRSSAGDDTQQLLQALADAPGPSGFEEPVRKIMVERMKPLSEKLSYDGLGSVIAVQGSSGPRIMVDAHMDELGGMVRRVTNDGYLTMQMLGGWLDQALVRLFRRS
jgi:endoglucanase